VLKALDVKKHRRIWSETAGRSNMGKSKKQEKTVKITSPGKESSPVKEVIEWNRYFTGCSAADWNRLPEIELYMDQVVTFLDRQMTMYRKNEDEKVVTRSMINNYTKDRVIPRAEAKKYSKEHIALITVVCSLKKVLSIPDLSNLLKDFNVNQGDEVEKYYELFCDYQKQSIERTSRIISESLKEHESGKSSDGNEEKILLKSLALKLAVEAQTQSAAAEQILSILEKF